MCPATEELPGTGVASLGTDNSTLPEDVIAGRFSSDPVQTLSMPEGRSPMRKGGSNPLF